MAKTLNDDSDAFKTTVGIEFLITSISSIYKLVIINHISFNI